MTLTKKATQRPAPPLVVDNLGIVDVQSLDLVLFQGVKENAKRCPYLPRSAVALGTELSMQRPCTRVTGSRFWKVRKAIDAKVRVDAQSFSWYAQSRHLGDLSRWWAQWSWHVLARESMIVVLRLESRFVASQGRALEWSRHNVCTENRPTRIAVCSSPEGT